jgi:predicted NBD/HSP70 family sugar kinase
MAVYVGIDVHKKYCQAALIDDTGQLVKELRFDNTSQGASSLITFAKSVNSQVEAVVEPSANFWIRIYDQLEDEALT